MGSPPPWRPPVSSCSPSARRGGRHRSVRHRLTLIATAAYTTYAASTKRMLRLGHPSAGVTGGSFGTASLLLLPVLAFDAGASLFRTSRADLDRLPRDLPDGGGLPAVT